MREFNPQLWFGERVLKHVPPHFTKASTPLSDEALLWVNSKLIGRYAMSTFTDLGTFVFESYTSIHFEDAKEAMMYELRWSGSEIKFQLS